MDRSTVATLITYTTWTSLNHLQMTYHPMLHEFERGIDILETSTPAHMQYNAIHKNVSYSYKGGEQRCKASMDSNLEAFSRDPTDDSFAVLVTHPATSTKYLNEVFLSY